MMAVDMFMKIATVTGESKDKTHKGEIDVLAWSWGESNSGSFHMGGGGGAGKVNVQDLSFTKYVDSSTPALLDACATGDHFTDALLTVRKAGTTPLEYIKITMKKVLITAVSTGGSGGEDRLTENVTLNFAEINYAYVEQDDKGAGKPAKEFKFNIEENAKA
jgi:type VI secretion system secreted protein Hcp